MFSKKKETKRRPRPVGSLAQYGIFEVPETIGDLGGDDDDADDEDLEAELAALTSGNAPEKPYRRKAPPVPVADLDKMINESLKDDDFEDEDVDEDDPELLAELNTITGEELEEKEVEESSPTTEDKNTVSNETVKLIEERLLMYKTAVQKAKERNDSSRARRYLRGLKTLENLLTTVQSGDPINNDDIPPELPKSALSDVPMKPAVPVTSEDTENSPQPESTETPAELPAETPIDSPSEAPVSSVVDEETLNVLKKRMLEYRIAAVAWKKAGNVEEALRHVKIVKQFELVMTAISEGNVIDLSNMPPTPTLPMSDPTPVSKEESEQQQSVPVEPEQTSEESSKEPEEDLETALKNRLEVYRRIKVAAEEEGNSAKVRRYGRICKQFEDALKLLARGKPVPIDELPATPGFPPLSEIKGSAVGGTPTPTTDVQSTSVSPEKPQPIVTPKQPSPSSTSSSKKQQPKPPMTRADKQMKQLQQRQLELKQAALKAKKDGDLELARDYLRQAKGMQPLINASLSGLPVDMNSIPLSPQSKAQLNSKYSAKPEDDFTTISAEQCVEAEGTDQQIYENMEKQLLKQIKWCLSTRDHSKALGDVPGYNKWERLALGYSHDLDMLRVRKRDSLPPPQHHYEIKTYAIVQSCTEINNSDIELSIIRGVNYPKETDSYVIYEFPYPPDNKPTDRTATIRNSSNPEYNAEFMLSGIIDRNSRQCQRAFIRHALKCQVWEKGCSVNSILCCCTHPSGFFRGDRLLGTVSVKLQPLQTQCILHDSFPLMDGRKATGGKLEVKLRLRNPIVAKQIEQITDKWLIIDH